MRSSAGSRSKRAEVKRLMTIPGVDATVALSIVAAVGDFRRFGQPEKLVSYLGLNPRVRQSGSHAASHGRITEQGRAHARGMLVEAAFSAARIPGPLRAFFERVRARRGTQIAIVATARKLVCLCWTMIERGEDYAFARPSLTDKKLRALELRAGMPSRRGRKATPRTARSRTSAGTSSNSTSRPNARIASRSPIGERRGPRQRERPWPPANGTRLKEPSARHAARQASVPEPRFAPGSTTPTRKRNVS